MIHSKFNRLLVIDIISDIVVLCVVLGVDVVLILNVIVGCVVIVRDIGDTGCIVFA